MEKKLDNRRIAILATDGVEQSELEQPKQALDESGAITHIISIKEGKIKGWDKTGWGKEFEVDKAIGDANPQDYDALMLPGGVMNPDKLRNNKAAVEFTRHFVDSGKPIAAICHGPWTLIETGSMKGRTMTSYESIKTDLINAGANWVDQEVVVDNGLVTSRKPADIPAFNKKMIEEFAEGRH